MGLFKKIFKKNLTPEEQEQKSQEEREWAEKCYRAGERFGEKIGFRKKVEAVNAFGNKYPRTFFSLLLAALAGCFTLNYFISSTSAVFSNEADNLNTIGNMSRSDGKTATGLVIEVYEKEMKEVKRLQEEVDAYLAKDSLTHEDSLKVRNLLIQMKGIHDFIEEKK